MFDEHDIVGGLSSGLSEERRIARQRLFEMSEDRAISLLSDSLGNDNWRIRKSVSDVMVAWAKPKTVAAYLIKVLAETSDAARRNAVVDILTRIGSAVLDQMLSSLSSDDPHFRKLIVDILGAIKDPRCEKPIVDVLKDKDENVRMAAVEALSNYPNGLAVGALTALLKGPDAPLRFYAMESLSKMDVSLPIDEIKPLVGQRILRRAALAALGNCPHRDSVKILAEALADPSRSNRGSAVKSLGKLYRKHNNLRDAVSKELQSSPRKEELIRYLNEAVESSQPDAQQAAIQLLGAFNTTEGARSLINAARFGDLESKAMNALNDLARRDKSLVEKAMPSADEPMRSIAEDLVLSSAKAAQKTSVFNAIKEAKRFKFYTLSMTDSQFKELRDYMHAVCGIYFNDDMKFVLEKRLSRRLETLGVESFAMYIEMIRHPQTGKKEVGEAINILTTNETYFFREKYQLKAFKDEILPEIHARKSAGGDKSLKIWSAGCSSGEEVYTIAILIAQTGMFEDWNVKITGSDISSRVLEKASRGVYSKPSFREMPPEYLTLYFERINTTDYTLKKSLKEMAGFSEVNLVDEIAVDQVGRFDVIFCRNVIIYFDMEIKRKVIEYLHNTLYPGGYLLLGHSESLLNISTSFDLVHLKSDMVYRKPFK